MSSIGHTVGMAAALSGRATPVRPVAVPASASAAQPPAQPAMPASATAYVPRVEIWDMSSGIEQPVTGAALVNSNDPIIAAAYAQALRVDHYLRSTYGRNGWDGNGSPMRIVVHVPNLDGTPNLNQAYWDNDTKRIYLGDGDGDYFAPLGNAFDVLVHETGHAIVDHSVNLRYDGQQGGINESFSDVLAAVADPKDWLIGEDVFTPGIQGDAVRDLERPSFSHVSQIPDGAEVEMHELSGIPSLAAVRVAERIGRKEMGQIWYSALVDHLENGSGFAGAARATLDAAVALHGANSSAVGIVLDAWKSVGVDPRWKAPKSY